MPRYICWDIERYIINKRDCWDDTRCALQRVFAPPSFLSEIVKVWLRKRSRDGTCLTTHVTVRYRWANWDFHTAFIGGARLRYYAEPTEEYGEGRVKVEYVPIMGAVIYPCGHLVGITWSQYQGWASNIGQEISFPSVHRYQTLQSVTLYISAVMLTVQDCY